MWRVNQHPGITRPGGTFESQTGVASHQFCPRTVVNYQGTWPDGGNSVARFQQAVLTSWQRKPQTVAAMLAFLQIVTVPHTKKHEHNYTHYQAVVDRQRLRYYFTDCQNQRRVSYDLNLAVGQQPVAFKL